MTFAAIDAWWRRLDLQRAELARGLAPAIPRRWVIGYLEVCAFLGALMLVTEFVATSAGPAVSLPNALFVPNYYFAPLVVALLFAFAVAATLFLLLAPFAVPRRPRHPLRALAEAGCIWVSYALLIAVAHWSLDLRIRRIEAVTQRLTPAATAYLVDPQHHELPVLGVRGCTELKRVDFGDGHAELWAECSRGIGRWDQLFLRADGRYENPDRIQRLGAWAYLWD